jgi:hypothetical protein
MKLKLWLIMVMSLALVGGILSSSNAEALADEDCVMIRSERSYGGKIAISKQELCLGMHDSIANRVQVEGRSDGENWRGRPFTYKPDVVKIVVYRDATQEKYGKHQDGSVNPCDKDECWLEAQIVTDSLHLDYQCNASHTKISAYVVYDVPRDRRVHPKNPDATGTFLELFENGAQLTVTCS